MRPTPNRFTATLPARGTVLAPLVGTGLALAAGPALALTPQEVWDQNRAYLEASGYAVDAQISRSGDDLTLDEVTLTAAMAAGEDDGFEDMEIRFGGLRLTQRGEDVAMTLPAAMPIVAEGTDGDEAFRVEMTLTSEATGPQLVSGTPDDMLYSFDYASLGVVIDRIEGPDGVAMSDLMTLQMTDTTGTQRILSDDGFDVSQEMTVASLVYNVTAENPEGDSDETVGIVGRMTDLVLQGTSALPEATGDSPLPPEALLNAGMMADLTMTHGGSRIEMQATGEDEDVTLDHSSAKGELRLVLSADGVTYDIGGRDVRTKLISRDLPFPVDVTMSEIGFGFTMPLTAGEDTSPFGLRVTLRDAALPEGLWVVLDPQEMLPHEPLTLDAALSGRARLFHDLTDPEAMEDLDPTEAPGEITALSLDRLDLQVAGAALQAEGSFDVDNDTPSRLSRGMPKATGSIDITAQGVLGLVETLGQMGVIPQQQAMSVPMMMAMFARQVGGPDDLASTIEITEDEQLLINGTRMTP